MLIDTHIHVGQFFNQYHSPTDIAQLANDVGIDYLAVSSTTMCDEDYEKVVAEIQELISLFGDRFLPTMWITPFGLEGNIAWFLESDIKWRCLKVHPFLHRNDWEPNGSQFSEVIDIARELDIPLLIHTGNDDCCHSSKYLPLISSNSDITFILAHGQPSVEALHVIEKCDNVYVDSAFMDVKQMVQIVKAGFANRLLWGTDMLIPKHFFPEQDMVELYKTKFSKFKKNVSLKDFENVVYKNAMKVFKINDISIEKKPTKFEFS